MLASSRDRKIAVELICEAHRSGARCKACFQEVAISRGAANAGEKNGKRLKTSGAIREKLPQIPRRKRNAMECKISVTKIRDKPREAK